MVSVKRKVCPSISNTSRNLHVLFASYVGRFRDTPCGTADFGSFLRCSDFQMAKDVLWVHDALKNRYVELKTHCSKSLAFFLLCGDRCGRV